MTTPVLGAPELTSGQAVPETTVNEQVRLLEQGAAWFRFKSRVTAAQPGSPADGDCYLLPASSTGASWAGHDGKIAWRFGSSWQFITAREGFAAYVMDEDIAVTFNGTVWGAAGYTDEQARDAVGAMLTDSSTIDVAYNDAGDAETFEVIRAALKPTEHITVALGDEATPLTPGTKVTHRMPYAFTVTEVRAEVTVAQTSGAALRFNVAEAASSIFSTKLTFDNGQDSCGSAAQSGITITTLAVLSDTALADNAKLTFIVDQIGDGTAAGGKITLIGYRS